LKPGELIPVSGGKQELDSGQRGEMGTDGGEQGGKVGADVGGWAGEVGAYSDKWTDEL
jgi:hypothetical protein